MEFKGNDGEVAVNRKAKGAADCRDATDDVGAVDDGGIPSVVGAMRSLG